MTIVSVKIVSSPKFRGLRRLAITSDCGACGSAPVPKGLADRARRLADDVLNNTDPRATAAHWSTLNGYAEADGCSTVTAPATAAIDIALWDLRARIHGTPLWRELGGTRPRVPACMPIPDTARSPAAVRNHINRSRDAWGAEAFSLTLDSDAGRNLARVKAAASALRPLGATATLVIDARAQFSAKDAARHIHELEQLADIACVIAPTATWDVAGHQAVSEAVRAGVSNSPNLARASEFHPHLTARSLDVVTIDVHRTGITGALQIGDAAYGFELPIWFAPSPDGLGAQLAGAIPYAMGVTLPSGSAMGDISLDAGRAVVGDAPGTGAHPLSSDEIPPTRRGTVKATP